MSVMSLVFAFLFLWNLDSIEGGWIPLPTASTTTSAAYQQQHSMASWTRNNLPCYRSVVSVIDPNSQARIAMSLSAGFGGDSSKSDGKRDNDASSSSNNNKNKSNTKNKKKTKELSRLKPKQQWDRFLIDLKGEKKIRVAVRVSEAADWLEVGNVRSKDNKWTEIALARQRALVAEHARRLYPLQITPKDIITWAFWNEEQEEWTIVDKSILEDIDIPDNLEKLIGFEGRPDPNSGFYCVYNEGRIVKPDGSDDSRPSSSKAKK